MVGACPRCCLYQHGGLPGGWVFAGPTPVAGAGLPNSGRPTGRAPGHRRQWPVQFTPVLYAWTLLFKRGAWLAVPASPPQSPFRIRRGLWMLARDLPHPSWVSSSHQQPQADFAWGACYYYLLTCRLVGSACNTCPEAQRRKGRGVLYEFARLGLALAIGQQAVAKVLGP